MRPADVVASGTEPVDERIGGVPARRITLVSGVTGSGRTCFAIAYLVAAVRRGEAAGLVTTDAPEAVLAFARDSMRFDLAPFVRSRKLTILSYGTGFDAKIRSLGHVEKPAAELLRLSLERSWRHLVFDTIDPILVAAEPSRLKQFLTAVAATLGKLPLTCICTATDSTALKLAADEFASHAALSIVLARAGRERSLRFHETAPIAFHFVPGSGIVSSAKLHGDTRPEVAAVKRLVPPAPAAPPAPPDQPTLSLPLKAISDLHPELLPSAPTRLLSPEELRATQLSTPAFVFDLVEDLPGDSTNETAIPDMESGDD